MFLSYLQDDVLSIDEVKPFGLEAEYNGIGLFFAGLVRHGNKVEAVVLVVSENENLEEKYGDFSSLCIGGKNYDTFEMSYYYEESFGTEASAVFCELFKSGLNIKPFCEKYEAEPTICFLKLEDEISSLEGISGKCSIELQKDREKLKLTRRNNIKLNVGEGLEDKIVVKSRNGVSFDLYINDVGMADTSIIDEDVQYFVVIEYECDEKFDINLEMTSKNDIIGDELSGVIGFSARQRQGKHGYKIRLETLQNPVKPDIKQLSVRLSNVYMTYDEPIITTINF